MKKSKQLGQVYTPDWIVEEILDRLDYSTPEILTKKILEPSCGDGAFLLSIVKRYIAIARLENYSEQEIIAGLEQYIYAIEIDSEAYQQCITKLNEVCLNEFGKQIHIQWNVFNQDTLKEYKKYLNKFDFIVGNPPYIRIHNLPDNIREFIKHNFKFTSGTTDMYLVFFEMCFQMLSSKGKLGFITPNSYLYNSSYKKFRQYLIQSKHLYYLCDFQSNKIFDGFSTYTAISLFDLNKKDFSFSYNEYIDNKIQEVNKIKLSDLDPQRWILSSQDNDLFLSELFKNKQKSLEDFFTIQYGFATLRDKIFIGKAEELDDKYVKFNGSKIEKACLYNIVKGSKYRGNKEEMEKIIFPYKHVNNQYVVYDENELKEKFPYAYNYLLKNKSELLLRDLDKNAMWYAFGRSQGIQNAFNEKFVISTLVNDKVHFSKLSEDTFVYSGIFITKKDNVDWSVLEKVLSSRDFLRYIRLTGKDFSGGYKSVSTKQIKNFKIETDCLNSNIQMELF